MNKILVVAIILMLFTSKASSQKLYVWCQKEQIPTPRVKFLEGQEIDLVLFDGRAITPNSKIECTSDSVIDNLAQLIMNTYPSARFNILSSEDYYSNPKKDIGTIKIAITALHAAFGVDVSVGIGSAGNGFGWGVFADGKWNAVTGYSIKIYDYSKGENKKTKDIGKLASKSNTGGYKTAKNLLNSTYIEANQEMFSFIDDFYME